MKATSFFTLLGMTIALVPSARADDAYRTELLGKKTIIQNSVAGWDGQIATVTTVYQDGSVRVKLENGKTAQVPAKDVDILLATRTRCGESHGVEICENDKVYYPNSAVTIGIPEGTVEAVFTNGEALVRDGGLMKFSMRDLGVEEANTCSSARPDICINDRVRAEKVVGREGFEFEGKVTKLYSNGVALVENSPHWRQSVFVTNVAKKIDAKERRHSGRGLASVEMNSEDMLPSEEKPDMDYYLPIPGVKEFKGEAP